MNIQPRGEKRWLLRWQAGIDPTTGQYRRISEMFHGTRREAESRWQRRHEELARGIGVEGAETFQGLWDQWLAAKALSCRPSTLASYRLLGTRHLLPVLATKAVSKITPMDCQRLVASWHQPSARQDGKPGPLSPRTIRLLYQCLSATLDQAVRWQLIATNPARAVDPPKIGKVQHRWWTPEQGKRFLAHAASHPYGIVFALALATGLRKGEILGLRWQDVDLDRGLLTVAQILLVQRPQGALPGQLVFGAPKTPESQRTIPIDAGMVRHLRAHFASQQRERRLVGSDYHDHGLVVQTGTGTPLSPRNCSRLFERLQAECPDLPRIRFHDLRHSHASWLQEMGLDIRALADRLGHTQISFTLQVYTHAEVERQRTMADQLGTLLAADSPPPPTNI